jgi:hypothetical protein
MIVALSQTRTVALLNSGRPTYLNPMNDSPSRRDFLKSAALLPLAAAAGAAFSPTTARAAVEPIKRVGSPMLKTSLNAYSSRRSATSSASDYPRA